jgi:hypothetical protein
MGHQSRCTGREQINDDAEQHSFDDSHVGAAYTNYLEPRTAEKCTSYTNYLEPRIGENRDRGFSPNLAGATHFLIRHQVVLTLIERDSNVS